MASASRCFPPFGSYQAFCSVARRRTGLNTGIRRCRMLTASLSKDSDSLDRDARSGEKAPQGKTTAVLTSSSPVSSFFEKGARLTTAAHLVWEQVLQPGDVAVDATCGNGHDTAFLAQAVGPAGLVFGFDVQEAAIAATLRRVNDAVPAEGRPQLRLLRGCHSRIPEEVAGGSARLVCFNLGYLPSADRAIATQRETTLAAIEGALRVVMPGGLLSVMCYTGHPGGMEEYEAVRRLLRGLEPQYYTCVETCLVNRPTAPILQLAWKSTDAT